jgi:hypothetical protein
MVATARWNTREVRVYFLQGGTLHDDASYSLKEAAFMSGKYRYPFHLMNYRRRLDFLKVLIRYYLNEPKISETGEFDNRFAGGLHEVCRIVYTRYQRKERGRNREWLALRSKSPGPKMKRGVIVEEIDSDDECKGFTTRTTVLMIDQINSSAHNTLLHHRCLLSILMKSSSEEQPPTDSLSSIIAEDLCSSSTTHKNQEDRIHCHTSEELEQRIRNNEQGLSQLETQSDEDILASKLKIKELRIDGERTTGAARNL